MGIFKFLFGKQSKKQPTSGGQSKVANDVVESVHTYEHDSTVSPQTSDPVKPPDVSPSTWTWFRRGSKASTAATDHRNSTTISKMSMVKGLVSRTPNMSSKPTGTSTKASTANSTNEKGLSPRTTLPVQNIDTPPASYVCTTEDPNIPSTTQTRITFLNSAGYILEKDVDSGAFANVYLVRTKEDRKHFAVKRINMLAKSNKKFIGKFLPREIWSHAQIGHCCLIRYYQTLVASTDIYMVMEWVARGNMLDHCRLRGRMHEYEAAKIMYQLCSGLAYMHVNNLCHRDIKCENLLLQSIDPVHVKIADFGFAKFLGPNAQRYNPAPGTSFERLASKTNGCKTLDNTLTGKPTIRARSTELLSDYLTRTFCGSLAYSSPELVMGKSYDGRKVDSWSAGCVMFILLTHRMAFREKMGNRALVQQQLAGVRWPQSCEHLISSDARNLCEWILLFNFIDRPFTDEILQHSWFNRVRQEAEREISDWNDEAPTQIDIQQMRLDKRRHSLSLNALSNFTASH